MEYVIFVEELKESTLAFKFKETDSKKFISLKKPYLEKVNIQPSLN